MSNFHSLFITYRYSDGKGFSGFGSFFARVKDETLHSLSEKAKEYMMQAIPENIRKEDIHGPLITGIQEMSDDLFFMLNPPQYETKNGKAPEGADK